MYAYIEKSKESKSRVVDNSVAQTKSNGRQGLYIKGSSLLLTHGDW